MSAVWNHTDREGVVHDDTGVYYVRPARLGYRVYHATGSMHCVAGADPIETTIGATRVRITVIRGLLRSPTLKIEEVADGSDWSRP